MDQIILYMFLSQAVVRGIDFAWKKIKESRPEAKLEAKLKELEAKHKKLQTGINRGQYTVNQQFLRLQPLLTQLTEQAKTTQGLGNLQQLLKELAAQISAKFLEKRIDCAYDGLDEEQLESRAYRYMLSESESSEHFIFTNYSGSIGGGFNPMPGLSATNNTLCVSSSYWYEHDSSLLRALTRPPLPLPPHPENLHYQHRTLQKASVENQRLFHSLEEIFNNPDLPEHHPDNILDEILNNPDLVEMEKRSFFDHCTDFYNNPDLPEYHPDKIYVEMEKRSFFDRCTDFYNCRKSLRDCLENLHNAFSDFQNLMNHIANSEPEIMDILEANLDVNKLCDTKLKTLEELTKMYREKQVYIQDWVETTALLLADDTISDEHRVVSAEDLAPAHDFLKYFECNRTFSSHPRLPFPGFSSAKTDYGPRYSHVGYVRLTNILLVDKCYDYPTGASFRGKVYEMFREFENLEPPHTLTAEPPIHRTDAIRATDWGAVYFNENYGGSPDTRYWYIYRRGEQSLKLLKLSLLKSREERIDQLCSELGVTVEQKKELQERLTTAYTANFQSWRLVKEAVDQWDWDLEGNLPPLWLFNTKFGYKSPKQITEDNINTCLTPIFQTRISGRIGI